MFVSQEILSYDHSQRPLAFYSHQTGTVRTVCCVFFSRVFPSHRKFTRGLVTPWDLALHRQRVGCSRPSSFVTESDRLVSSSQLHSMVESEAV